jgi:hypothetical protein
VVQRILHVLRARYALVVFWAYVAAFGVAFLSIFVFPPAALALVLTGLLLLLPAVLLGAVLRMADRMLSRPCLARGECPHCRAGGGGAITAAFECPSCGARFDDHGAWLPG